ncbi:hypothetical protein BDZ90DRAFT_234898 [Jaminaea rosea]|uniref:Uncharacterized protein n=1 Tax=Jaminaea rosea TaxID=1569628 RepID=A0A316UN93_9BASI|nr:hypothetical protein BDZ90DRAFT_234898 [Jaminaea rosea]PWN24625.1 hypothetical protein BDZ90DRAFT_234898 [Jaminaea rosea]
MPAARNSSPSFSLPARHAHVQAPAPAPAPTPTSIPALAVGSLPLPAPAAVPAVLRQAAASPSPSTAGPVASLPPSLGTSDTGAASSSDELAQLPLWLALWRFSDHPSQERMTDFTDQILDLIKDVLRLIGRQPDYEFVLQVMWRVEKALAGMEIGRDGVRRHRVFADAQTRMQGERQAEVVIVVDFLLWQSSATHDIASYDNGFKQGVYEHYPLPQFLGFVTEDGEPCKGRYRDMMEAGEMRRVLNHMSARRAQALKRMEYLRPAFYTGCHRAAPGFQEDGEADEMEMVSKKQLHYHENARSFDKTLHVRARLKSGASGEEGKAGGSGRDGGGTGQARAEGSTSGGGLLKRPMGKGGMRPAPRTQRGKNDVFSPYWPLPSLHGRGICGRDAGREEGRRISCGLGLEALSRERRRQ